MTAREKYERMYRHLRIRGLSALDHTVLGQDAKSNAVRSWDMKFDKFTGWKDVEQFYWFTYQASVRCKASRWSIPF